MTNENLYRSLIGEGGEVPAIDVPGGARISFGELDRMSARYANALKARGVAVGDRVLAQTEKSLNAILLYLATVRAGAIYVPINTAYTAAEASYFVGDAKPRLFVCDPARADEAGGICAQTDAQVVTLGAAGGGTLDAQAASMPDAFETEFRSSKDLAAILYTSGTTGRSKGAMLSHGNLLSNAETLCGIWGFGSGDVLLHALPIFHTHGLFVALNVSFLSRARVILLPRFDPESVLRGMTGATVLMGVPTFYTRLLAQPGLDRAACANMRLFISGSAPLRAATHDEWRRRTGHAILERYGMTETNMNTSNPLDGERRPGTVGFPLPGVALRIAEGSGQTPLAAETIGMIQVKGPNVFQGYWNMPEKTSEEFTADGFFVTGDLGKIDQDGYVHIVGRGKDLVISGGYNIYPKEIEIEIDSLDNVLESAVFGVDDPDWGEKVIAAVVREGPGGPDRETIEAHLSARLARFKRPADIVFVGELPRNTMGKVQKNALRADYLARQAQTGHLADSAE